MFDLYLLDLDGLLVRTEELHFAAYEAMCARRGFALAWDFPTYCLAAHYGQEQLRAALGRAVPGLFEVEPRWEVLHREKSRLYLERLADGAARLQPGAAELLEELTRRRVPSAVVTNSSRDQTRLLVNQLSELQAVSIWVTREDYERAKPHPDGYYGALLRAGVPAQRAVGVEDTPRGVAALRGAGVPAVLVSAVRYPLDDALEGVARYSDLLAAWPALFGGAASGTV